MTEPEDDIRHHRANVIKKIDAPSVAGRRWQFMF